MAVLSEADEIVAEKWRNVFFSTPDGKSVLEEILGQCHLMESVFVDDPAQVQMRNFGVWMLYRLGVYQDRNIGEVIDKFASIPYKEMM